MLPATLNGSGTEYWSPTRFPVGSTVFVWTVVVGLTALAIIAKAESTPARL